MRVRSFSRFCGGALVVLLFSSIVITAQTHPTFTRQQYTGIDGGPLYTADLNNDGVLDLVQPAIGHFVVRISNGDGTWQAPKNVAYPSGVSFLPSLFAADVNNDGKVDVVIVLNSNKIAIYPGHGDGSFGAPNVSAIAAAAGTRFLMVSGADFNHDGKIDLIVAADFDVPTSDLPGGAYYLLTGNGTTSFSAAKRIFVTPAGHVSWSNIAIGDFDADSNADVAITDASGCSPKHCVVLLHILFGNGAFGFTTVNPSLETSDFVFGSGDVNNDGKTDLFGTGAASHSYVVYGRRDRAMTITEVFVPGFSSFSRPAIADLNGDGRNDIAGTRFRSATNDSTLLVLLHRADGTFAAVDSVFFGTNDAPSNSLAVGDFNKDTRPDLAVNTTSRTSSTVTLNELVNTTTGGDFGGCAYPSVGQGIHICKPAATTTSPVTFNASANSFQPIRKLELWIDGKKATEQFHIWDKRAWFRSTQSLAAGTHRATFIAANPDNTLLRSSISFTVSGTTCQTPASATGTVICSPPNGTTVSSPVNVQAKGGSSVKNMEVWVDGVRKFAGTGNTVSLSLSLAAGSHKLTIFSKNGSTVLSSAFSNFTVK